MKVTVKSEFEDEGVSQEAEMVVLEVGGEKYDISEIISDYIEGIEIYTGNLKVMVTKFGKSPNDKTSVTVNNDL